MIPFRIPQAHDACWVRPLLEAEGLALCNYSFPVLFCWQDTYGFRYAPMGRRLLVQMKSSLGHSYLWPAGEGDPRPALEALAAHAHGEGEPLRLIALTQYHKNWLEDCCPGRFCFVEARDGFDYLYAVDRLADLPGKKLHAKRNHIHRLDEAYPGWTWSWLTRADVEPCRQMDRLWLQQARQREEVQGLSTLDGENRALDLALTHWQEVGLEGVVLRWQDQILGFSLGAPLTETIFDVHFERARADIQGAYPAVNRSFAQAVRQKYPHIRYLDREDDMGLPGLRKAKLSYRPDYLQVNFSAVECCADK